MGASQLDLGSIQQRGQQEVSSGGISVRLYTGYITALTDWPLQILHIATDVWRSICSGNVHHCSRRVKRGPGGGTRVVLKVTSVHTTADTPHVLDFCGT